MIKSHAKPFLKIFFISADKFPPFRVDVSILFGKEIVSRGHHIDWLLQSFEPVNTPYEKQWLGGKAIVGRTFKLTTIMSRIKNHLYSVVHDLKMFRILRKEKFNIIIVKDKFISGLFAIAASKIYNIKIIYWLSYPFPEDSIFQAKHGTARYPLFYFIRGHLFRILLYRILLPLADHILVQTEYMRKNIVQEGIHKRNMTAVPMAVSVKDVPFWGHKTNVLSEKNDKMIVYLGTLVRIRKIEFLLKVFKQVLAKEKHAKLYLVGGSEDPSDEEFLINEAKRLQIENSVTITGFLPQKDAWNHIKTADVCVSPIYPAPILNCGSPTKLIEYMAMGKAAVANDHPEQEIVISESGAGVCVPYEEKAFADGIIYLLDNPEIARQMGIKGRKYIERKRNYEKAADIVEKKLFQVSGALSK